MVVRSSETIQLIEFEFYCLDKIFNLEIDSYITYTRYAGLNLLSRIKSSVAL